MEQRHTHTVIMDLHRGFIMCSILCQWLQIDNVATGTYKYNNFQFNHRARATVLPMCTLPQIHVLVARIDGVMVCDAMTLQHMQHICIAPHREPQHICTPYPPPSPIQTCAPIAHNPMRYRAFKRCGGARAFAPWREMQRNECNALRGRTRAWRALE